MTAKMPAKPMDDSGGLWTIVYAERAVTHTGSLAGPLGIKLS
jgi:hypothetical protein